MLLFASYYDQVELTLGQIWFLTLGIPVLISAAVFGWSCFQRGARAVKAFDATSRD